MGKLPFFISIPHGGTEVPPELNDKIIITKNDLFDDSDAFTREIYNVSDLAESQISMRYARAFLDLSRSTDMLPPDYPDGIIKSATCYNKPIYKPECHPDVPMQRLLIRKYYYPYHCFLKSEMEKDEIMLGLDCHSMAAMAPEISPDKGSKRPLINLGDAEGKSCDPEITGLLKTSFMEIFGFHSHDVTINKPFKGGHIIREHGNNPKPWIQIEMNRILYLSPQWFNRTNLSVAPTRINELNNRFRLILELFYKKLLEFNFYPIKNDLTELSVPLLQQRKQHRDHNRH
ncbi:MAG: N-formylglutamate amidohydrolase [Fidelibacterota bacterium]